MAELRAEERTEKTTLPEDYSNIDSYGNEESPQMCCMNGDLQDRRQRPISVIGGVNLFSPDSEKHDCLPSVSTYI